MEKSCLLTSTLSLAVLLLLTTGQPVRDAQPLVIWALECQPAVKKMPYLFSYGQSDVDFFLS